MFFCTSVTNLNFSPHFRLYGSREHSSKLKVPSLASCNGSRWSVVAQKKYRRWNTLVKQCWPSRRNYVNWLYCIRRSRREIWIRSRCDCKGLSMRMYRVASVNISRRFSRRSLRNCIRIICVTFIRLKI